jgi:hypothetical protein
MALRLEDRRTHRDPAAEARLSQWLGPLHLRLRLIEQRRDSEDSHGWLEDGDHLVLRRGALLERLRQSPGYEPWREAGGALRLDPGVQA